MARKTVSVLWGLALVVLGGIFLSQEMGWINEISTLVWLVFFAAMSAAFFVTYFVSGPAEWGWLFPAFIFAGLATTMGLDMLGIDGSWVAAPVMLGVSAPFWIVFARDRLNNWWALIPGSITAGIALVTILENRVPGEVTGSLVLFSVALPFLLIYLIDRKHWWALIPGGIMAAVGIIPLLTLQANENLVATLIMFVIAVPFVVVYILSRKNWWAIIPAGIMASIGVAVLFDSVGVGQAGDGRIIAAVMFAGWALTFGILWLLRGQSPTTWAKYPAIGLAILSAATLAFGENSSNLVWPVLLIGVGIWIVLSTMRKKQSHL